MASEHLAKEHQIEVEHEEDDNGDVEEEMRSTTALPRKRGRPRSQGNKGTKLMRKNNLDQDLLARELRRRSSLGDC